MSNEESFGRMARERRRALDLTQEELARRVGCAAVTIRKIEYNEIRPSQQIAERLAMALAIPLDDRAEFVRQARAMRPDRVPAPTVTPSPKPEEIGTEDLSGRAIRGYALGERIGAGGFGAVYRAVQPLVEREVAIKIILPQYANHPEFIRRFEAEAQLVARLEHPHIVPLYDYWREPGVAYLVMRLLRGGSVQAMLQGGPLPLETVARMLEQIGSALGAAHRAGVVHRDLKPANILLDEDTNAYLADFGIAKNLGNPNLEDQTQADVIVGSPAYFSPEQIRSETVRPQADIYSLGVVLYELLTGARPFQGPTPIDLIQQHLTAPLPPLAAHRAGLPAVLDAVIDRATAKNPRDRYPDVESLLTDVRRVAAGGALAVLAAPTVTLELPEPENPYKGLRAFGEADAADFFGRETLTQQLLARLAEGGDLARFLAVVGPSGSGKSSVVKAGLIPALRRGGLPGSENWFVVELLPGAHPLEELEAALLRIAVNPPTGSTHGLSLLAQLREDTRGLLRAVRRVLPNDDVTELVLVIDQFEEVFTLLDAEREAARAHLLNSLVTAVLDERSRVRVILTLRADFTDRPLRYVDFGELVRQRSEFVLPLTPEELERAITAPAERVGLKLEPGLAAAILRDVNDQPGALPLLQYALTELFEKREGHTLTRKAYAEIGGVLGALGRRAEEIFGGLDEAGQETARQLFLRLVTLGEGTEDTRRRVLRSELESLIDVMLSEAKHPAVEAETLRFAQGDKRRRAMDAVIEAFGKSRLLSFDRDPITRGPTVEVAHEALLREWSRLRDWLQASRADVRMQRQLANAADEWQSANREQSFLLSGARLAQFEGWAATSAVALTSDEQAYLDAGMAERDRHEAEERERQQRELEAARKLAETERARAESEKQRAEEQVRYVARVRTRNRVIAGAGGIALVLAMLAGLFGWQSNQNAATAQAASRIATSRELAAAALSNLNVDPERSILLALQAVSTTYSVDKTVLPQAEDALHRAVLASRARLTLCCHMDSLVTSAYSPDGTHIATASQDGTAKIWDAATGKELLTLQAGGDSGAINSLAYSPDGTRIATGHDDGTAKVWDVATGRVILTLSGHSNFVYSVAHSSDGAHIATASGDNTVKMWDAVTGRELYTLSADHAAGSVAFSPDGKRFATAGDDNTVRIWDVTTGNELFKFSGHTDVIGKVAFSPDGTRIATVSEDNTARVWDAATGVQQLLLNLPAKGRSVAFSPNGKQLATSGFDGTATVWDANSGKELLTLLGHTSAISDVSFRPDGTRLATAGYDNIAKVWDITASRESLTFMAADSPGIVSSLAYSPDGTHLVTANNDEARVWDAASGQLLLGLLGHSSNTNSIIFSPDGTRLLTTSDDQTAKVWDAATGGELLTLIGHTARIVSAAFSPDGKRLATASADSTARIWDASTGREMLSVSWFNQNRVTDIAFSPNGKYIVTTGIPNSGDISLRTIIWDPATGQQLLALSSPGKVASAIAFSPDGKQLALGYVNGSMKVYNISADGLHAIELYTPRGHSGWIEDITYSLDGKRFTTASDDGTTKIWDAATGQELLVLSGHDGEVHAVAFSPDGTRLTTGGVDGTVRIYLLKVEDLVALAHSRLTRTWTTDECQQYLHVEMCP